jgi:TolB protein
VERSGKTQPLHAPLGTYATPRFSPDGKRLAFSMAGGHGADIWVRHLDRDSPSRLTSLTGLNRWPVWTPDGKNIVFQSTDPGATGLYWTRSDGSGEVLRLTDGKFSETPHSFSPDGNRLAFFQTGNGGSRIFSRRLSKAIPRGRLRGPAR